MVATPSPTAAAKKKIVRVLSLYSLEVKAGTPALLLRLKGR
jgi:hypothetical protein